MKDKRKQKSAGGGDAGPPAEPPALMVATKWRAKISKSKYREIVTPATEALVTMSIGTSADSECNAPSSQHGENAVR